MRRKLLLLDLALALLVVYAGWHIRQTWQAAKQRAAATLNRKVPPVPEPPHKPLPPSPPVVAGNYADVVQKMLFDRSRNPAVPIELPAAPPPKPMPPLPIYHGQMNIGGGLTVIMSQDAASPHQGLEIGDTIGQFKLVDVNTEEITLEWDGQRIRKSLKELQEHGAAPQQVAAAGADAQSPVRSAAPAAPAQPQSPQGPGQDIGSGIRACQPNDSNPPGAVVDGYRKATVTTPFGTSCRWDPVH